MLDIIIPVYNEEQILTEKCDYYKNLSARARLVFIDGGSTDHTALLASQYGDVFCSPKGRGRQKNFGAQCSRAEHLVFLHVDTYLNNDTLVRLEDFCNQGVTAGCLLMRINDPKLIFRVYESVVNFRARAFGISDGDLGLVIRRTFFQEVGGFDELPIMEDLLFGKKIRQYTQIQLLDLPIEVSSRKWKERGFLKTLGLYTLAYIQLWSKIPFFKDESKTDEKQQNGHHRIRQRTRNRRS